MDELQVGFVFLPSKALDFFQDKNGFPVVILIEDEPVGFLVLHYSCEIIDFSENDNALFLRAFSIDRKHQGKGYAKSAMNLLPLPLGKNKLGRSGIELGMHYSLASC
ncbi:GNAT family N-acetyltransferase [Paenibacillus rhizovicinus]|uniref:GNAT family N-acetyltransferase n=1 Tax=Paenibacillus rhizovicinus TaxID=2704463 RepID=A0A6C0NV73_9BACL|nr:GNAT family N-acetyltransferase [Paenibacillus rhizovicinus]QHW29643.1 GNAT family N-acetyltransferase [Paenibacillus rhizovicinus]